MDLCIFSIIKNNIASGPVNGYVATFYASCPITSAKLLVADLSFDSIYSGPETVRGFDLYKIVFFENAMNLPLSNAERVTLILTGSVDNSMVLYTTVMPDATASS